MDYNKPKINKLKLSLYVLCASLASLISELGNYSCPDKGFAAITPVKILCIVLNFLLQGLIAWRAFIDDSTDPHHQEKNSSL